MTMRTIVIALAVLTALLGAAHIGLTALIYPSWTLEALWFLGSGLAMVIGAAANILALGPLAFSRRMIIVLINAGMTIYFAAAWQILPEPQVMVGALLFAGLAISTLKGVSLGTKANS